MPFDERQHDGCGCGNSARRFPSTAVLSAIAHAMIGLLPCLFIYLAPYRVRQGFPFGQREYVPKLCQANLGEVLVDPAGEVCCFSRLLRCHR